MTGGAGGETFIYSAGDAVAGESVNGGAGYDVAYIYGSNDFSTGTFTAIEQVYVQAYDPVTGSYPLQDVSVTFTGAQLAGIQSIYANYNYTDPNSPTTTETITANVASGTTVDLSTTSYSYFYANDKVLINGAAGNETITGPQVASTIHGNAGNDTIMNAGYWFDGTSVFGDAGNDRIFYGSPNDTVTLDGGADTDTLAATANYYGPPTTINLGNAADQTGGDNVTVKNFENVDWSASYYGIAITGSSGANAITGSSSADTIDGAGGADTVNGGAGNDIITYYSDATLLAGGGDIDTLIVKGAANINLAAADQGVGDTGTMTGFENVDASASTVAVTLGGSNSYASTLTGGSGNDTLTGGTAGATISGGAGDDTITAGGTGNNNYVTGGAGKDIITGSGGQDQFYYGAGDVVSGESLNAGAGYDIAYFDASAVFSQGSFTNVEQVYAQAFDRVNNTVLDQSETLTFTGAQLAAIGALYANTQYSDTTETVVANVASGTTVDLSMTAYGYFSGTDIVQINGAASNETITGTQGVLAILHGNGGADTLHSGGGSWYAGSTVFGDAGNDRIDYGYDTTSVFTLDGGADSDTLVASYPYISGVTINLGLADQTAGDGATVQNFENVDWSSSYYGMTITGSTGANVLTGGTGDDIIDGAGGADTIDAGAGNDMVTYRSDATLLAGGDDTDTLIVLGAATINLGAADQGVGDTGTMTGFENVNASASTVAETLKGSDSVYTQMVGGSAADTITAGAAGSHIVGRGGADTLVGSTSHDVFDLYSGDFVAGESISGNGGGDDLWVNAITDLTVGTVIGVSTLHVSAFGYDSATVFASNTPVHADVTVTMTGVEAAGLSTIYANPYYSDTIETISVALAAAVATDLSAVGLGYFTTGDSFNVNGSSGGDIFIDTNTAGITSAVHGNGGNDVLHGYTSGNNGIYTSYHWGDGATIFGDAGNDTIDYSDSTSLTIDGGGDTDTLRVSLYEGANLTTINLGSTTDQTTGDSAIVKNFENVDARGDQYALNVTGTGTANTLIGGYGNDTLNGAGGNDLLDGGDTSTDTLTGGAGQDTFRWIARDGYTDSVTDFSGVDDKLQFASSQFDFNGPTFNTAVNDTTGHLNLAAADLIYTASVLNSATDVVNYLQANGTGTIGEGAFILGKNGGGETVLYHTIDASGASYDDQLVADFGTGIQPGAITLSDFAFI